MNLQFEILNYINLSSDSTFVNVLNHFHSRGFDFRTTDNIIRSLIDDKLVRCSSLDLYQSRLSLTPAGSKALIIASESIRNEKKNDKRYWITTVIALVGATTGTLSLLWNIILYIIQ